MKKRNKGAESILAVSALQSLVGKKVKILTIADQPIRGVLTDILYMDLVVGAGQDVEGSLPSSIRLDNEEFYTWKLEVLKKIEADDSED